MGAASPARWADKDEEYAFYRRRDHDHIEAVQDYVIARLAELRHEQLIVEAERAGLDPATPPVIPPKARQMISSLQGSHGGGILPFEEFERDQLTLADLCGFTGKDSTRRSRVRGWLKALDNWQYEVGYQLFTIIPGGQITGHREDGTPIRARTRFIDHLLPLSDAAVQRARASELWRGQPEKGIRPHIGAALAAQADWVIAQLPKLGTPEESGVKGKQRQPLPVWVHKRGEMIAAESRRITERLTTGDLFDPDEIDERIAMLDVAHERAVRALDDDWQSARKMLTAMRDTTAKRAANAFDAAEVVAPVDEILAARDYRAGDEAERHEEGLCNKKLTQGNIGENAKFMLEAALEYARNGVPVFPLWPLSGDVCSCPCGPRCAKAEKHVCGANCASPGKHPCTSNGFAAATTNERTIRQCWGRWAEAGIGVPTGQASGWLGVDRDDRHGGDASLGALVAEHGDFETLAAQSGSGAGAHYIFAYPEDVEIRNSAGHLGNGLDVRGEGGYLVVAPTLHVSGKRYGWRNTLDPAPLPLWMRERLLTKKPPAVNQDYTPNPNRSVLGAVFAEGERNDGLFRVACGIWGKGQATDLTDLHAQLLDINARRCNPPLPAAEVACLAAHVAADYPRGAPVTQAEVEHGAAAYSAAREVFEI